MGRGVDDRGERRLPGEGGPRPGQGVGTGHLTLDQGDPDAQGRQLPLQLGVLRVLRAGAGQHQVGGAVAGEPAGGVPAQAPGAAGDQHRSGRMPAAPAAAPAQRGADQPLYERPRGPYRDPLAVAHGRQRRGHGPPGPVIGPLRKLDQPAAAR